MLTEFQNFITLVSSSSQIGATVHFPLPISLLLMKAYSLDTICNLRSVSTLLSSNAAVRAPSLHDVKGGDDGLHLYDHGSQTSHAPQILMVSNTVQVRALSTGLLCVEEPLY